MPNELPLPECVQMKHRIQAELEQRYAGLTPEQRRLQRSKDIEANPILGPLYKRLQKRQHNATHYGRNSALALVFKIRFRCAP